MIDKNVGGTDRRLRAVLAVMLAVVAVSALRNRQYSRLAVATVGAVGLGFNAVSCFCGLNRALGIDTTDE